MVPSTSGANFDDVAGYVGTAPGDPTPEVVEIRQRQSAGGKAGPERERDMHKLLVFADGAFGIGLPPQVLRNSQQLGLGIADLKPAEAASPVLLHDRFTYQPILDSAGTRKPSNSPARLRAVPDARHPGQATVPATPHPTVGHRGDESGV